MTSNYSIKQQISSTIMATVTFALLLSSLLMLIYSINVYYKHKAENLTTVSQLLSRAVVPALQFDDHKQAQSFINLLMAETGVINGIIYNNKMQVFAFLNPFKSTDGFIHYALESKGISVTAEKMYAVTPIYHQDELLGVLVIESEFQLTQALRDHLFLYFIVFIASLITSFWFSLRIQHKVVNPLVQLTQMLRKMSITHHFEPQDTLKAEGEIGSLIQATNQLLHEVQEKGQELASLNQSLQVEVSERIEVEKTLKETQVQYLELNQQLEHRVKDRTQQLELMNKELEAFSYSVSHDLRAPLRAMDGFSQALIEDYYDALDEDARDYLNRIRKAAQKMGLLIDDMLSLSKVSQIEMKIILIDLSLLVQEIFHELSESDPQRSVKITIEPNIKRRCDPHLMKIALTNLIQNAWKYSSKNPAASIEFGQMSSESGYVIYIRDNGVGFNMKYFSRLFVAFQRLHSDVEFSGTGIGLATVKRVINRHAGLIWADAEPDKGATFYFTLSDTLE